MNEKELKAVLIKEYLTICELLEETPKDEFLRGNRWEIINLYSKLFNVALHTARYELEQLNTTTKERR